MLVVTGRMAVFVMQIMWLCWFPSFIAKTREIAALKPSFSRHKHEKYSRVNQRSALRVIAGEIARDLARSNKASMNGRLMPQC